MPASYPTSVKTFTTKNSGETIQAADVNDLQTEVNAIEAGLLNGTAQLNSSNSTMQHVSVLAGLNVVGNSTLASTITVGTLPYIFPASGGSTGQVLTISSTSGSTMSLAWQTTGPVTLLKASNGTDVAAGATTVDSVAISGLTANDTLRVITALESSSQATAQVNLYSVTDSLNLIAVSQSPIAANGTVMSEAILRQRQGISSNYVAMATGMQGGPSVYNTYTVSSITTLWTNAWTLGLRHGGVTAGGTFKYQWAVYKMAGQ